MWKWAINFPQCLRKCLGVVKKMILSHKHDIEFTRKVPKENEIVCSKKTKNKNPYTHDQPSSILELHSVIVHSDFELLRSVIMWPVFFMAVVTAVLVVVVIILFIADPVAVVFFAAAVLVVIAVTVIMSAAAIVALDVDFLEVIWQIPGLNKHVWVLSFIVVLQSVKGSIISLSVSVSLYFTLIEACGGSRENQKLLSLQRYEIVLNTDIYCTCRLAIVVAIGIWKADSVVTAFFLVFAFNHSRVLFSFALTFLTAVTCVPPFIELARNKCSCSLDFEVHTHTHTRTFWQSCSDFEDSRETYLKIHIVCKFLCKHSHTWYFLPLLSTHPHCWIGTQILPLCTNPSSHAHPCVQGWLSLQPCGPFRYSQVGLQARRQVV